MSLLVAFVGATAESHATDPIAQRAQASLLRHGHANPVRLSWPGGHALWFGTPGSTGQSGACLQLGKRFAAYVGAVHWQGLTGEPLLRQLLAEFREPRTIPWRDFSGAFAMLLSDGDGVWLLNDAVGLQKIYVNADRSVFTTSLLLSRSLLTRPRVNRLRAQEYVLLGGNHAHDTAIEGVRVQDPTQALELRSQAATTLHAAQDWRVSTAFRTLSEAVDTLSDMIATDFAGMLKAFGPKIGMALSGGFDSRLLLAGLDHVGVQPTLYVYGAPEDDDVRIALARATALGMAIECVDKRRINAQQPPLDRSSLRDSISFFDGLPIDGVFDRGADRITRLQQVQGGTLNLNGGGGEILRNFFYLPDRSYTAEDLVGAFYSNWLPQVIPSADEAAALRQATAAGILGELGLTAGNAAAARKLARGDVELVYTLFRLRYWMSRNNTVAARYGSFMTPLVHPRLVALAATVPLHWKTHGDLEAAIINKLSPRVAQGPSNYGFEFATGPTAAHRRHIAATLYRPIAARRRSARIRRLLGRNASVTAPPEWTAAFAPCAVDWIDPAFLTDSAQVNRLMTLCAVLDDDLCGVAEPPAPG